MDMSEMMHKLKQLVQEADSEECNMTAEGESCPVHGMDECDGYMEESTVEEAYINTADDAIKLLGNLRALGKKIELGQGELDANLANQYVNDVWDVYTWLEGKADTTDPKFKSVMDPVLKLRATAKGLEREPGSGKNRHLGNEIVNALYPLMQWIEANVKHKVDEAKSKKPDADGDGIPDWADKHPHKKGGDEDRKDESISEDNDEEEDLEESIHITLDGPEAEEMLNRIASLAGVAAPHDMDSDDMHADHGVEIGHPEVCSSCGSADCDCDEVSTMENADHDHGHEVHSDEGEPVDPDTYMWRARSAPGTQGIVKGTMGDNPLIKEDANALYKKLAKDYKTYVAEADLARSNTGNESPLTATDRDDFDKDPFAGDEPVTDGTRSPLSTIKRQKVSK